MNHDQLNLDELNIPYLETTKFGDYTINIEHDDVQQESPRDWEPLGTMVCWPRDYGDDHGYETPSVFWHSISGLYTDIYTEDLTDKQMERCYTVANANNIVLPLKIYEHSGVNISIGQVTHGDCQFDTRNAGYIFVSKEDIRKEYSVKSVSQKRNKEMVDHLENEVKIYNQYLNGEIFWFNIEKVENDETVDVDSCGGFFGYDDTYMIDCIKDALRSDITHSSQQLEMF